MSTSPEKSTAPAALVPPPIVYKNGQREAMAFPELSFAQLYRLADLVVAGDTPGVIAHCLNRNAAWVESLTFECFRAVAKYLLAVNFQKLVALAEGDPIMGLKIGPTRLQLAQLLLSAGSMISAASPATGDSAGSMTSQTVPPVAVAAPIPGASSGSPAASSPPGAPPASAPAPSSASI